MAALFMVTERVAVGDQGEYTCRAVTREGTSESNAVLEVKGKSVTKHTKTHIENETCLRI